MDRDSQAVAKLEKLPLPMPIPTGETAFALLEREIPDPTKFCDPWIVEGLNLIAGRPKLGKTTLERQKMAALVMGESFFGADCQPVRCAFLSLEEGERLSKAKFKSAKFPEA